MSYFKIKGTSCQIHLEDDIFTAEDSKGKKKSYEEFDMFGKNIACQLRNIDFGNYMLHRKTKTITNR